MALPIEYFFLFIGGVALVCLIIWALDWAKKKKKELELETNNVHNAKGL